jgi:dipeptidyl aminopeptidase/acylaminoacyl peptidase
MADPMRAAAALEQPSPAVARLLATLSPERVAGRISARLVLVHGVDDPSVPYTESLRLAAARPARTRVVLVRVLDHVEAASRPSAWGGLLREAAALLLAVHGLRGSG